MGRARFAGMARRVLRVMLAAGTVLVTVWLFPPPIWAGPVPSTAGPWRLIGWRAVPAGHDDQGVALPRGRERIVLRGNADVPAGLRARGWRHIGDPGTRHGLLLDALQASPSMAAKLFVLTGPDGRRTLWRHRLVPGELINNSFVAIAPSGRWFVSGEWGTMRRLLVFPMPGRNPAARVGTNLPLAATIRLTRPVRNVQGCSFAAPRSLVCATDDPGSDLFGVARQLLAVRLSRPVDGRPATGSPVLLGAVPQVSWCGRPRPRGWTYTAAGCYWWRTNQACAAGGWTCSLTGCARAPRATQPTSGLRVGYAHPGR